MAGSKDMKSRNSDLMAAIESRMTQGAPSLRKPPESPSEAKTSIGQLAIFQGQIADFKARAEAAEAELEHLKATHSSHEELALAHRRLSEAESALAEALRNSPVQIAKIIDLHEVPGRRRRLSPEQYAELRANLEHNPLTNPVSVRVRANGGYEIVAGNNRVAVFRDLGRDEIPINILDLDDDETERAAFYSNLLAPSLPDYEKYIGFKHRMERRHLNQSELAAEAGVSQPFISSLMAFEHLPPPALACISDAPALFGANAINKLAKLARKGKHAAVIDAVQKIASGELTQSAAVHHASVAETRKRPARPEPVTVRSGKSRYCEACCAEKTVRLSFASAEEATAAFAEITDLLKKRADAAKNDGTK